MMNDFVKVIQMLGGANIDFDICYVEGEHPCICIPSKSPFYSAGVTYSFNDDGSLYSVHSYEPVEDCGCGGCEDALTECLEIDASGMTPEEFIKTCFEILEGGFSDEV